MKLVYFYATLGLACALWNGVSSGMIYSDLKSRGESVNFFLLKMMAPFYAHRYRRITLAETGRTGPLFYHWVISINATLAFALVVIVLLSTT